MHLAILTKEFPPHIYGGAGVHVDHLTRELARIDNGANEVHVYCFGDQNGDPYQRRVTGVTADSKNGDGDARRARFLEVLQCDVAMIDAVQKADVIHCHTWYTHLAGCLARQMTGAPLVLTTHSLEPHRPWKREQLGRGYDASSWIEKTAYQNADGVIAVSASMKRDVMELYGVNEEKVAVIPNGVDDRVFTPVHDPELVRRYGIDPHRPYALLVARITRQKGIDHFLNAAAHFNSDLQVLLCASAPDTSEMAAEVAAQVNRLQRDHGLDVAWADETVPIPDLVGLYSQAALFVCPSVYEPFGIINLEAMACGTPVVASAVGGIPEVVQDGVTGRLVPLTPVGPHNPQPRDPDRFARDLAAAVNELAADPDRLTEMGRRARQVVEKRFSWSAVARKTLDFYRALHRR